MKEHLTLLERAMEVVPRKAKVAPEEIQDLLAVRMVDSLFSLSADFENHRESLSPRSLAVIARAAIEAMFRLRGALHSNELAIDIVYTSAIDDLDKIQKMDKADPDSNPLAKTVIDDLRSEKDFLESVLVGHAPKKRNTFYIAEKVGCESHYRANYFSLSQYTHSNYATFGLESSDLILKILDEAVMGACLIATETIAERYSHPDESKIRERSKVIWNESTSG